MTKKLILGTVLMLSLTLMVGCSQSNTASNSNSNVEQNSNNNNSNTASTNETKTQKENVPEEKKIKLSIYSDDVNTMEIKEISTIEVNETSSLEDKLKALSKAVSEKCFDNLPIEVKSIDTIKGKKIATINLKENDENKNASPENLKAPNWYQKFQGSTGGQITSDTLINTFVPAKVAGEWIDGVKFLYNGQPIESEHTPELADIKYRN